MSRSFKYCLYSRINRFLFRIKIPPSWFYRGYFKYSIDSYVSISLSGFSEFSSLIFLWITDSISSSFKRFGIMVIGLRYYKILLFFVLNFKVEMVCRCKFYLIRWSYINYVFVRITDLPHQLGPVLLTLVGWGG